MTAFAKFIKSVDYGDLQEDGAVFSCVVIWSDESKEIVTSKKRLNEIHDILAAQQRSYLNK